jgi:GntR family transcriptional regulator
MLIVVDPSSGVPVFRQVMDQVRFHIASGLLKPGDELPATRTLSAELGVNPMTISKAYNLLERDGILKRRPGKPLVVAQMDATTIEHERTEQLRSTLSQAVRATRQLGVEIDRALAVFRELLTEEPDEEAT